MSWMTRALRAPDFGDEEKTRRAQLANVVAWLLVLGAAAYGLYRAVSEVGSVSFRAWTPALGVAAMGVVVLYILHRGAVNFASSLLVLFVWAIVASTSWVFAGLRGPVFAASSIVVVLAGLLLGGWASAVVAAANLVLGWVLSSTDLADASFLQGLSGTGVLAIYAIQFLLSWVLTGASNRGSRQLLKRIRDDEQTLRTRNWELQRSRDFLEQRVMERTEDLNRRTRHLEAAAQVATVAGEILDVEQLMSTSAELIRSAFGLYYVGLFTVDGTREWAVLRAGTGEEGAAMLSRGHRIRVGEGMIGWCIEQMKSRFAQRAERDHIRLVLPELPATRAEVALPLRVRGRVVGALTVQSAEPDFFDEATVTVLQTMADLLAIALNNAELFEDSRRAVAAVQRAYGEAASQSWGELLQARGDWGYHYVDGIVRPARDEPTAALGEALGTVESAPHQVVAAGALAIPLSVGGRNIGALSFQRHAAQGPWEPDDVALLSALADQLSQALDSARLLQETQRLAVVEQQINDIVSQLTDALDADTMLLVTIGELGRLPGVLEASVHVRAPQAKGYRYRSGETVPEITPHSEAQEAATLSETVVTRLHRDTGDHDSSEARGEGVLTSQALAGVGVPIRLRDQVLGALNLRFVDDFVPRETVQMMEQVADRLAASLETARLLEETRLTAERERLISDVSQRVRQSLEIDEVLESSVREIRDAMDLFSVSVRLAPWSLSSEFPDVAARPSAQDVGDDGE